MMRRASNPISCEHVFSKKVFKNKYNEKIQAQYRVYKLNDCYPFTFNNVLIF